MNQDNDYNNLLNQIQKYLSNKIDKKVFLNWISNEFARNDTSDEYESLVAEMMSEMELLETEKWDSGHPEQMDEVTYSKEYIESVLKRINLYLLKNNFEPVIKFDEISKSYAKKGYNLVIIEGVKDLTKDKLMNLFSSQLSFPSYFGKNWDALKDCLSDLSWIKNNNNNTMILIKNYDSIEKESLLNPLLEIIEDAHNFWIEQNVDFNVILFH
ncbi:MAG: barstar family protein [Candidatus Gracilibacteria bacterium]|jgi:RNAse (barnase) inhibitor barstar